jgi:thioredoxin
MCKKLILLLIVFGVLVGFSSVASALPLIGEVLHWYDGAAPHPPEATQEGGWTDGNFIFSDRTYTWNLTPAEIEGAEYVRTFNDDADVSNPAYSVTFPIGAMVLLACDDRYDPQQAEVDSIVSAFAESGVFTDTGWDVYVFGDSYPPGRQLSVFSAVLGPGTYVFGAPSSDHDTYVIGALDPLVGSKASNPDPADGAFHEDTWFTLSWKEGNFAVSHDIYFGDNFDNVNDGVSGTFQGNQTATSFNVGLPGGPYPDGLILDTTYYWRIDEVEADGTTVHKGDVWSFTTARAGRGLQGQYYHWSGSFPPSRSAAFSNLVMTRVDPKINFNWGYSAPAPLVNADNFSVKWTGKIQAAFTETYTFYTTTDDGVRLWVDGQRLINKWREQVATEWSGTIDLAAGQKYDIVMEMYENQGHAVAQLRWSSLHTPKRLIPQAALLPPGGVIIELTDGTFDQTVLSSDIPVLVDFWAPWCGPCWTMAPVIQEIANEYAGKIKTCKLNVDYSPNTNARYDIMYIPTFILFKDGRERERWVGVTPKGDITAAIDELVGVSPSFGPLSEALDTTLSLATGGNEDWFSQTTRWYHDGDAVQSGDITHDQESWMQTTVNGAGRMSFYWKVSSENSCDYLEFYIDGARQDRISGSEDWHKMTYEITGSALHTLEWRYFKDRTVSEGDDCGWVDKVEWVSAP